MNHIINMTYSMNQNKLTINLIFDVVVNIEKYFTIQFSKNI